MENDEALRRIALRLCIEVGAISECEYHPGSCFDGGGDVTEAFKRGDIQISCGEVDLPDRVDRAGFSDLIKDVYEDNSVISGCASCEKIMRGSDRFPGVIDQSGKLLVAGFSASRWGEPGYEPRISDECRAAWAAADVDAHLYIKAICTPEEQHEIAGYRPRVL
ncbi:MAG TPA: hypothetical protein VF727_16625 [Allosphingosinicella sp.]|jgi:hypothetical protein